MLLHSEIASHIFGNICVNAQSMAPKRDAIFIQKNSFFNGRWRSQPHAMVILASALLSLFLYFYYICLTKKLY